MKNLHLLVADDSRESADLLCELLQFELPGTTVDVAYDGQQALRLSLRKRPDVVILDLEMPGYDGQDVAERIRDIYPNPPRLIAVSGHVRRLAALHEKNAFERVLYKPTEIDALIEAIEALCAMDGLSVPHRARTGEPYPQQQDGDAI